MPRTLDELDAWARDHERRHTEEASERKHEDDRLLAAVKQHVEGALKPLADVPAKIDALAAVNAEQLAIAKESAEERGRRKEREEALAQRKSEETLALEKQKADSATEIGRLSAKNTRWQIIAAAVTAIAVAVISAIVAAHR